MAEITRTHGTAFGAVSHNRGASGSGALGADEPVIANGPVLELKCIRLKVTQLVKSV